MDVRLEDAGDVVNLQPEMDARTVVVHPEDGATGGQRGPGCRRIAGDDLAATGQGRFEAFLPRNHLAADLAAGMVGQGMNVDVGVATANVGQELRERMPEEWTDQAVRGDRALRKQPVDLAGGGGGLEEEGDHRSVDPGAVQMNVGLE